MMKRTIHGVVVGLLVVALALVVWKVRSSDEPRTGTSPIVAAKVVPGSTSVGLAIKPKIDPRTQKRGSIAGTVRDEAKAPISKARVCAGVYAELLPKEITREPLCVETNANGEYQLTNLYVASYVINAGAPRYRPATYKFKKQDRDRSTLKLAEGEAKTGIDLVLRSGGVEVTGTVSDISGGPVEKARVSASGGMWGDGDHTGSVETDAQGTFSLWTSPGQLRVSASADGYASASELGRAPGTFELLLTPESSLSGIVVDAATNKPIEGARVSIESTQWSWDNMMTRPERSDAKGAFRIEGLTPGRYVVTAHSDHGYGRTEGSTMVGLGQHVDGVIVKTFPAYQIIGKVMMPGSPPTVCTEGGVGLRDEVKNRWVSTQTEEDGTVHADGVLPGTYTVQVYCEGYRSKDTNAPVIVVDKDVTGLIWEVEGGAKIHGKVLTKSGAVVEDARVSAASTGGDVRAKEAWGSDRSKADGSYELEALRPGGYRIEVESNVGVAPREGYKVEIKAGATIEQNLTLEDGGTITGRVVDEQGKPVGGVTVDAQGFEAMSWFGNEGVKSDDQGAFTLDAIRPGDYRVIARRGWSDRLRKPGTTDDAKQGEKVTVAAGKTATVKLVVESQSGMIRGSVVDAQGKPVSDAFISTARESDAAGAQASSVENTRGWGWGDSDKPVLTSTDGAFVVKNLSPGNYTLRAYRKGGGEALAEHVAVGTTARLQIKDTGSIEGVVKRDGALPDEITITVEDLKTRFSRDETFFRTSGRFTIHDLPAGHFLVTASAADGNAKTELDLASGETKTGVTLTLAELVNLTGRVVDMVTKAPVPGMLVFAAPAVGGGGGISFTWGSEDRDHISDSAGKFTIKRAPRGQLMIQGMAKEWKESDYSFFRVLKTITGTGTVDLGDLPVIKKRIKDGEKSGELGLHFAEQPNDTPPDKVEMKVSFIDPAGPAAKTEIKVGDIITSVDGVDVTGGNAMHAWTLMHAPPGTKLTLGLARGATVVVVLAPPT